MRSKGQVPLEHSLDRENSACNCTCRLHLIPHECTNLSFDIQSRRRENRASIPRILALPRARSVSLGTKQDASPRVTYANTRHQLVFDAQRVKKTVPTSTAVPSGTVNASYLDLKKSMLVGSSSRSAAEVILEWHINLGGAC